MGVIKRGILGGFSGRVANVVGGSWKGIAYMRALPLSVANPKTAAQTTQRGEFAVASQVGSTLLTQVIKPLRDRFAIQESGFNTFIRKNIAYLPGAVLEDLTKVSIAEGVLTPFDTLAVTGDVANDELDLSWVDNTGTGDATATDEAIFAVYNATKGVWTPWSVAAKRSIEADVIELGYDLEAGDVIHLYGAFRNVFGDKVSDTSYVTKVMP